MTRFSGKPKLTICLNANEFYGSVDITTQHRFADSPVGNETSQRRTFILGGSPLRDYLEKTMVAKKTIDQSDVDRFVITDSPNQIAQLLSEVAMKSFGLKRGGMKPRWWLFE